MSCNLFVLHSNITKSNATIPKCISAASLARKFLPPLLGRARRRQGIPFGCLLQSWKLSGWSLQRKAPFSPIPSPSFRWNNKKIAHLMVCMCVNFCVAVWVLLSTISWKNGHQSNINKIDFCKCIFLPPPPRHAVVKTNGVDFSWVYGVKSTEKSTHKHFCMEWTNIFAKRFQSDNCTKLNANVGQLVWACTK